MSESKEILQRIKEHKGVDDVLIVTNESTPGVIRQSKRMDEVATVEYATDLQALTARARSVVRDLDPENDLTILRIRCKKHEILVAPEKEFTVIVIQDPQQQSSSAVAAASSSNAKHLGSTSASAFTI